MDAGAIERLGEAMAESHAQQASITTPAIESESTPPPTLGPQRDRTEERESEAAQIMREHQQDRERDVGREIE